MRRRVKFTSIINSSRFRWGGGGKNSMDNCCHVGWRNLIVSNSVLKIALKQSLINWSLVLEAVSRWRVLQYTKVTTSIEYGNHNWYVLLHYLDKAWYLPSVQFLGSAYPTLALDDFTAQNGFTNIVPGSHKWPTGRLPGRSEAVSTACPAGSVIYFLGRRGMVVERMRASSRAVLLLDWVGVDLSSNPPHPLIKSFDSRNARTVQSKYIL